MLPDFREGPVELADDFALVLDPGKELALEVTGEGGMLDNPESVSRA
jgi:hypothetical protein